MMPLESLVLLELPLLESLVLLVLLVSQVRLVLLVSQVRPPAAVKVCQSLHQHLHVPGLPRQPMQLPVVQA